MAAFWPSRTHRDLLRLYLCSNVYVTIVFCCWMVGHRRLHQRGARRDRPTPHRARPGLIYPVRLCVGMADGEAPHAAARSRDQVGRPLRTPRRDGRRPVARQRRVLRPNALPARCLLGQYLRGVPPSEVARPRDLMPRAVRDGAQSMSADAGQRHTTCTSCVLYVHGHPIGLWAEQVVIVLAGAGMARQRRHHQGRQARGVRLNLPAPQAGGDNAAVHLRTSRGE